MYRYSTPTLTLRINQIDFSAVDFFRIAIAKGNRTLIKQVFADDTDAVNVQAKTIVIKLTQEETASFSDGEAEIQVRAKFLNGNVVPTNTRKVSIKNVLDREVI